MSALDPGRALFRAKSPLPTFPSESAARVRSPSPPKVRSPVKVPERFKSPEPPSIVEGIVKSPDLIPDPVLNSDQEHNGIVGKNMANGTTDLELTGTNQVDTADEQGLTRKKVVKVVRRVVKKVMSDKGEAMAPTKPSDKTPEAEPAKAVPSALVSKPATPSFSFKHNAIKTEDKDDISQGLTSLMVRGRTREPRPRLRRDERLEKLEVKKISGNKDKKVELDELNDDEQQEVDHKPQSSDSGPVTQETRSSVESPTAPSSSKSAYSRSTSLPPVVGFVPAPKPSTLAPPPGFIPAPKPTTAKRLTPVNLPVSISPPSRLKQTPDPSNPCPQSPPPGALPTQQAVVSQEEVQCPRSACPRLRQWCGKSMTV